MDTAAALADRPPTSPGSRRMTKRLLLLGGARPARPAAERHLADGRPRLGALERLVPGRPRSALGDHLLELTSAADHPGDRGRRGPGPVGRGHAGLHPQPAGRSGDHGRVVHGRPGRGDDHVSEPWPQHAAGCCSRRPWSAPSSASRSCWSWPAGTGGTITFILAGDDPQHRGLAPESRSRSAWPQPWAAQEIINWLLRFAGRSQRGRHLAGPALHRRQFQACCWC